ncbi:hypothetical protein GJ496_007071 [Pomphorhynchus laevis]|nr:hypothetical protein GJ496_007071 [Pomphorhynchus laevis]
MMNDMQDADPIAIILPQIKDCFCKINDIWLEMGYEDKQIRERSHDAINFIKDAVKDIVDGEIKLRDHTNERVLKNAKEIDSLTGSLGISSVDAAESIRDMKTIYAEKWTIEKLQDLYNIRDKQLDSPICFISYHKCPSQSQLDQIRNHIVQLESLKQTRQCTYQNLRKAIIEICEMLEENPQHVDKDIWKPDEREFHLTGTNLDRLDVMYKTLSRRLDENKQTVLDLADSLKTLWKRLDTPVDQQQNILSIANGGKPSTIHKLELEKKRCDDLKAEKIEQLITNTRKQIREYWTMCCLSEFEKNQFQAFHSSDFNETNLTLHECEIKRLQDMYKKYKIMFEGVNKWKTQWDEYLAFLQACKDPKRFHQRGFSSIKEERLRKKYEVTLPKMENNLIHLTEKYEQEHGHAFLIYGKKFSDTVQEERVMLKMKQQAESKSKKTVKKDMEESTVKRSDRISSRTRNLSRSRNVLQPRQDENIMSHKGSVTSRKNQRSFASSVCKSRSKYADSVISLTNKSKMQFTPLQSNSRRIHHIILSKSRKRASGILNRAKSQSLSTNKKQRRKGIYTISEEDIHSPITSTPM